MKAILKFDLDRPEERELHKVIMQAEAMYWMLTDILEGLRRDIKHGLPKEAKRAGAMRDIIIKQLGDYKVDLHIFS